LEDFIASVPGQTEQLALTDAKVFAALGYVVLQAAVKSPDELILRKIKQGLDPGTFLGKSANILAHHGVLVVGREKAKGIL
jgi:hypothetical protein